MMMQKLALTGRELAEMYALNAMGVPSSYQYENSPHPLDDSISPDQMNYLIDTEQGRSKLIEYAKDLAENIKETNDERLQNYINNYREEETDIENVSRPSNDELIGDAEEFINEKLQEAGLLDLVYEPRNDPFGPKQYRMQFSNTNRGMMRSSQSELAWGDVDNNYGKISDMVNDFANEIGTEINEGSWTDLIWDWWGIARYRNLQDPNGAITEFLSMIRDLSSREEFLDDFWPYYFDNHKDEFSNNLDEDSIRQMIYDPEDEHWAIDDAVRELDNLAYEAGYGGKREDYLAVLEGIDNLSSMSHHGGPAFEYADTTDIWGRASNEPNLIEVMNRKFGDRFVPWLIASGNFPEEHLEDLQEWYDEMLEKEGGEAYLKDLYGNLQGQESTGNQVNKAVSSDRYYQHPYHSQKNQWLAQNSPTYRNWTPFDADTENQANVQSVARSAYERVNDYSPRQQVMRDFLSKNRGEELSGRPNVVDTNAVRPRLDIYSSVIPDMIRSASLFDHHGAYDVADRMEGLIVSILRNHTSA